MVSGKLIDTKGFTYTTAKAAARIADQLAAGDPDCKYEVHAVDGQYKVAAYDAVELYEGVAEEDAFIAYF